MSDINRAYHARKRVRLGGRTLEGWTPKQVAELQQQGRERSMTTKPMTAIGRALIDKGIVALNVAFQIAITKFQNGGGQFGVAYAMLCAAYGRSPGQRIDTVDDGDPSIAEASERDAGQSATADKAGSAMHASRHSHARRGADAIAYEEGR